MNHKHHYNKQNRFTVIVNIFFEFTTYFKNVVSQYNETQKNYKTKEYLYLLHGLYNQIICNNKFVLLFDQVKSK